MTEDHPRTAILHDHAEGLLGPPEEAAVEAHLRACAACAAEVAAIRSLRAEAAALPAALDPGVDLRPGIRARIAPRRRGRGRLLAAAAIVLIAIPAALITWWQATGGPDAEAGARAVSPVAAGATADAATTVLALDREYTRAGSELRLLVNGAAERLPPETLRLVRTNVAVVERALAESRAALLEDPSSPVLRALVLTAHRQRLEVLRQAAALVAES